MLEQFILIALIIIILLLVSFVVYLRISDRQRELEGELNEVSDLLDDDGD